MGLSKYKAKRDFESTPEPAGKKGKKGKLLSFVIQKHNATRLHYDFRLELEGVLKSWAIPKGPSMKVGDKRLAVMVEDHPFEYKDFYGEIPEGNYGAGIVDILDKGTYKPYKAPPDADYEKILNQMLMKGDLKVVLDGKYIKGAFALVRLKNQDDDDQKNWLMIKKKDSFELSEFDISKLKPVIQSGLKKQKKAGTKSSSTSKSLAGSIEKAFESLKKPMRYTEDIKLKGDADWLFENNLSGNRVITKVLNGECEFSFTNHELTSRKLSSLKRELKKIEEDVIFDGVIVTTDSGEQTPNTAITLWVFDLLYLNGHNLIDLPLKNRKELLNNLLSNYSFKYLMNLPVRSGKANEILQERIENDANGIIAKDPDSNYEPGKSSNSWIKIAIENQALDKKKAKKNKGNQLDQLNAQREQVLSFGSKKLKVTNLSKIYWPDEGITKGELVSYYQRISKYILPYLKNRPQSLNRFPNGIKGSSFYHKDMEVSQLPSWVKTVKMYSKSNEDEIDYLICNDAATLAYMSNLGCIEINPWHSVYSKPEYPDYMILDLDPGDISFKEVVNTALVIKELCDELKIDSYCKTSGASGLHIYIPTGAKYDYDQIKTFAEIMATISHNRIPEVTTIERVVSKRGNKIYIDFLQNRKGQTIASAYSVRPKPQATVSTPLLWEEVNQDLSPQMFTIHNIEKRLERVGDLWNGVLKNPINLHQVLAKLEKIK